jgi:long-subunit acyl-CoA synthetase (AMP-forming)
VRRAAKALIKLGVQPHSVVAVIGFNSQRLFIAYLAAIMAGGIGVSMYTTNSAGKATERLYVRTIHCQTMNVTHMNS